MTITLTGMLQGLILIGVIVAFSALIEIIGRRSTQDVHLLSLDDRRRSRSFYDNKPLFTLIYHGRAVGVVKLIAASLVIGWCLLGLSPVSMPLRLAPERALAFALITAFAGFVAVVFFWLFTNKSG